MKAYTTRVGAGPYPTELHDAIGEGIAMRGHEFGTTTGRRRRVGWFDAVPLRYAVDVNSVSSIVLNKLDSGRPRRDLLCVAYEIDGRASSWPGLRRGVGTGHAGLVRVRRLAGAIHEARLRDDLPSNAGPSPGHSWTGRRADPARLGRSGADPDGGHARAPARLRAARVTAPVPRRILLVGGGGREHALAGRQAGEDGVAELVAFPGSDAIAALPGVRVERAGRPPPPLWWRQGRAAGVDLVVSAPMRPCGRLGGRPGGAPGSPRLRAVAAAARNETSKAFCHEIAAAAGIPMRAPAPSGSTTRPHAFAASWPPRRRRRVRRTAAPQGRHGLRHAGRLLGRLAAPLLRRRDPAAPSERVRSGCAGPEAT